MNLMLKRSTIYDISGPAKGLVNAENEWDAITIKKEKIRRG